MKKTITSALVILLAFFSLTTKAQHHLYGVCSEGGPDNIGGIFHYSPSSGLQTFDYGMQTIVYGGTPQYASLFDAGNGKFYGTTKDGSNIYEWDSLTNVYTVKHILNYNEGSSPRGAMIKSGIKLFGLTEYGGDFGKGAIYSWNPISNVCEARASFNGSNGENPLGSLIELGGKFYGISIRGGASNEGALFEFDSISNTITKKFDFGGTNGVNPFGTLKAYAGKLYGMCHTGGANNNGVIFEWDPGTDTFTKKIDLLMASGGITEGSLTLDGTVFYGTTLMGGALGGGVIFEWDPVGNIYTVRMEIGSIGATRPKGDLVKYGSKYYATTENGGAYGGGVIYEWDPVGNTLTKKIDLHPETGDNGYSALTLSNNKFYGNTNQGGAGGKGVIFQWDPVTNVYTPKIHFSENAGAKPKGKLTYHSGKFYGMTQEGGKYNGGVIFEWDPSVSSYTVKVNLNSATGTGPYGSLVLNAGKFYGATAFGGANAAGTIFEWDPATNIFTKKYDFNFTDGHYPFGTMSMSGGKFYGTTYQGGAYGGGAIYEWDPVGNIYTKKHDLNPSSDGMGPQGGMFLYSGMFYGLTNTGGANNVGTIYEWDPVGNIFTKKVDLSSVIGSSPVGNLAEFGGKLYGMTRQGGANSHGVIFEWDPVGNIYTPKVDLQISATGGFSSGTLRLFNSKFYGTIEAGGTSSRGTLFEWDPVSNAFTTAVNFTGANGGAPSYGELLEICATLPAPTDITPAANLTICEGNSTTLSVSGEGTISWYDAPTGGTNLGSGSSFITPVLSTSTSYYAEAFSDCGTGASTSRTEIIVTVNPIPTITIAAPTSACENTATTLTASGADYYVWVSGGTSDVEIVYPTILVSVTTITLNTYTVTGTDLNGCSNTVSHLINAEVVPTVMITGNISVCDGESTILTATGADSYVWSSGGTSDIESISPTFSDTYSVTGTSLNGCSNSYTEYITVNPLPMVNASGKMFMCEGQSVTLMAMGADSYVWSSGGLTDTVSFSPSTTTGYSVTGTDLNGCSGMDSFTITVNSNPVINITGTTTICEGESTLLTASGADSYSWSTGSFSDTETVSPTSNTTYTVSGTNAALCNASVDVAVTVHTLPFISALSTSTYNCSAEAITLTGAAAKVNQQQTLDSYYFIASTVDRIGQSFIASESAPLKSIVVNFINFDVNPGTFVFELFDGAGFGGTSIFIATHTNVPLNQYVINTPGVNVVNSQSYTWSIYTIAGVNQAYIASKDSDPYPFGEAYYSPDLISAGTPTTEDLWFKTIIETSDPHTYTWDNSVIDGLPYFASVGTNTYTVIGSNAFGCSSTSNIEVVTISSPVISVDNPVICEGDVTTITVSGTDAYEWSTGSTNTAIVTNPLISTTYVVTGTAINGCTATLISTVTVNALPAVVANATLSTICAGETTTLTGSGAVNYTWDNGITDNTAFNPGATQTYTVTGTDANLCVNTDNIVVTVNALPTVSLSTFSPVCFSVGTYTLTGGTPAGGTYSGTNITGNIMDVSTLSGFNTVTYQYTDGNGCTNTNNENIFVEAGGNVTGIINANGVPITNGEVYLFEYSNGVRMDTLSTVILSGTAAFTFTNVGSGSYLIFAKPAITNNNGAYNGGATFWQNATPFSINCTETLTFTIETTTSTPLSGGTATLSGRVQEGDFFGSGKTDAIGDPIPGVDISLEQNPGGIIISTTQTDVNGDYRFNNVNEGSYRILADIPGTPTVSVHSVDVVGANNWINLDYYVDSNQIYINPNTTPVLAGIKTTESGISVSVYPNPTHGEFIITSDKGVKQIGIRIVDVLGKELLKMNSNTIYTKIDINDQPNGIYFVEISSENSLLRTFKISKQ